MQKWWSFIIYDKNSLDIFYKEGVKKTLKQPSKYIIIHHIYRTTGTNDNNNDKR